MRGPSCFARLNSSPGGILAARVPTGLSCRPRENMVGVDMVLAQYPQNTLYHRIYIIHDLIQ